MPLLRKINIDDIHRSNTGFGVPYLNTDHSRLGILIQFQKLPEQNLAVKQDISLPAAKCDLEIAFNTTINLYIACFCLYMPLRSVDLVHKSPDTIGATKQA